jgi:replicative superfamily II helicase
MQQTRFHGLFIGVDRYASPDVHNLASAVRDATALHALFTDNLGTDCRLVTDEDATVDRFRRELRDLQTSSSADDVVVVAFSGHGTNTHQIVTYDSDLYNLPSTSLPLDELTELVSAIPAKHLLVVLDCCFSGGAGAKVLTVPLTPRGGLGGIPLSTDALLDRLAGTGRLILTAATADQEAYEDARIGHGLLTYHLLQALLGPEDVAHDGKISLLDLLQYVTQRVKGSASGTFRARQEPTLRGQWDGEVIWPTFTSGPLYNAVHPPLTTSPVTKDIQSLRGHGIPEAVLDRWAEHIEGLNQLQQDAVNEAGLLEGRNVLVVSPTSSGKTLIGELAAIRATQNGGRSVFLLPTKALVNEQQDKFERLYVPVGVRTIRATGDFTDQVTALMRGQFDIAVLTYEMFSRLALANPHLLRMVTTIVVDEVQNLVDPGRGQELEFLLTLIKSRRAEGIEPQLIALSAVLGNLGGLDSWLDAHLLERTERPVPLDEGVLDLNGTYRYVAADGTEHSEQLIPRPWGDARAQTLLIPLVKKLVDEGQQVAIIRATKPVTRQSAIYLANALGLPPATDVLAALPAGDPSNSSNQLRRCLQGGVAFHISDLDRDERRVIEEAYRAPDSPIRVIVATTTLAQGVNLPAETVIVPEVSRKVGPKIFQPYRVAEYKNIVGRAGRLGFVERGRAIVLALGYADTGRIWQQYVKGTPEDIRSVLLDPNADVYTLVLRVVALASQRSTEGPLSADDVVTVLASSFAAHQNRLSGRGEAFEPSRIATVLSELQREQFVSDDGAGLRLTELGEVVANSGLAVRSAVTVAAVFRQSQPTQLNRATIITTAQLTAELDATPLAVNTRGVAPEFNTFVTKLEQQATAPAAMAALRNGTAVVAAGRAKKAVACLLWMNGHPAAELEQIVMKHYFDRNAIGPIRGVASRTQDVIGGVLDMAAMIHPTADLARLMELLPIQLELGIPADLAPLALAGADLTREQYLTLISAGLKTPDQIGVADDETLLKYIRNSRVRLRSLREAIKQVTEAAAIPSLDEALPPPTD